MKYPIFPVIHFPQFESVQLPPVQHVHLSYPRGNPVTDIPSAVKTSLNASHTLNSLFPGARVAIATGSRGIAHIADVVTAAVAWLKNHGFSPFIVPAMGSHGGATAEGQGQWYKLKNKFLEIFQESNY